MLGTQGPERESSECTVCRGLFLICKSAAAAAKSLQSCPTLCDPIDGSPPGSPIPGILQARTLEWVAIAFSLSEHRCSHFKTSQVLKVLDGKAQRTVRAFAGGGFWPGRLLPRAQAFCTVASPALKHCRSVSAHARQCLCTLPEEGTRAGEPCAHCGLPCHPTPCCPIPGLQLWLLTVESGSPALSPGSGSGS